MVTEAKTKEKQPSLDSEKSKDTYGASFEKGKELREEGVNEKINPILDPYGLWLERRHIDIETTPSSRRKENNRGEKRTCYLGPKDAMGLDYYLGANWTSRRKVIALRWNTDFDLRFKLPSDYKYHYGEHFLQFVHPIWFIILNRPDLNYYAAVKGSQLKWEKAPFDGHTNNKMRAVKNRRGQILRPTDLKWNYINKGHSDLFNNYHPSLPEFFIKILKGD